MSKDDVQTRKRSEWRLPTEGICDVWFFPLPSPAGWSLLLDADERHLIGSYSASASRTTYIASRAAQRLVVSHYLDTEAEKVAIERRCELCGRGGHGRPRVPNATLDYSTSHAGQWLVIAVVGFGLVGLDIESDVAAAHVVSAADIVLTANEHKYARQLPESDFNDWVLRAWTRKEAVLKLTGRGLKVPPDLLDVSPSVLTTGAVPDWASGDIYLRDLPSPLGYCASLATTIPPDIVRIRDVTTLATPLRSERGFRSSR